MTTAGPSVGLSVVVPAKDAAGFIERQLDALCAQSWSSPWEIVVVVDSASKDATAEIVRRYATRDPRVRLITGDGGSPARARNVGARSARGDALAFCDADDVVSDRWVAAMGDALADHDVVTGPLDIDLLNASWVIESRGRAYTSGQPVFEGVFPYASSCNVGVRRSVFSRMAGFNETIRVGEDIDLSLRLWLEGTPMHFEPAATVHYRYRPSIAALYGQARSYGRVRPLILERVRAAGHAAPGRLSGARNWLWLLRRVGLLRTRAGRARWIWVAGVRVGNLGGSLRARRLYL